MQMLGRSQSFLYEIVSDLFPDQRILSDYRHLDLRYSVRHIHSKLCLMKQEGNTAMQLAVYVPDLKLAIEYLGEEVFRFHYLHGHPQRLRQRAQERLAQCEAHG